MQKGGLAEWHVQNSPRGTLSAEVPRLDLSRISAATPDYLHAPQAQRAGMSVPAVGGGVLLDDVLPRSGSPLQRSGSPLQRSHSPGVRSDSDGRLEAAGVLLEELSSLKGIIFRCWSERAQECHDRCSNSSNSYCKFLIHMKKLRRSAAKGTFDALVGTH